MEEILLRLSLVAYPEMNTRIFVDPKWLALGFLNRQWVAVPHHSPYAPCMVYLLTLGFNIYGKYTRWWFQIYFLFSPVFGEDFQFDEHIFLDGLKPPTSIYTIFRSYGFLRHPNHQTPPICWTRNYCLSWAPCIGSQGLWTPRWSLKRKKLRGILRDVPKTAGGPWYCWWTQSC